VKDEFENTKRDIKVVIDAKVIAPQITKYPVIRAKIMTYSEEFKNKLVNYYIEDKEKVYTKELVKSKEQLRIELSGAKQLLEDGRKTGVWPLNSEETLLRQIAECEELLETAPDETYYKVEKATTDFIYDSDGNQLIQIYQHPDDEFFSIGIYNSSRVISAVGIIKEYKTHYDKHVDVSEEEKQESIIEAEKFLKYFEIENMILYQISTGELVKTNGETMPCFTLEYKRNIGGTYVADVNKRMVYSEGDYSKAYYPEALKLILAEGEVINFGWFNPVKQVEVMTENAVLLPLEEVVDYAKKYNFYNEYITHLLKEVKITEIRLNYMRVNRKDHDGEFLYIPVWDFMGYEVHKNPNIPLTFAQCMVTVNAIDGSYIDRLKGY
jgi:hypothetical protein